MHSLFQVKNILLPLVIILCLTFTAPLLLLIFPYVFNQQISQHLLSSMPFAEGELHISRITPWQATGSLRLGDESAALLIVPQFKIYFSPSSLLEKKVGQLFINSASIIFHKKNGSLQLPMFKSKTSEPASKKPSMLPDLPFALGSIHITNSLLTIYEEDGSANVFPFNSNLRLNHTTNNTDEIILSQLTADTQISGRLNARVNVEAYPQSDHFSVEVTSELPALEQLNNLLPAMNIFPIKGAISLESTFNLSSSFEIFKLSLSAKVSKFAAKASNFTLHSAKDSDPLLITGMGDLHQFNLNINGLEFTGPQNGRIEAEATLNIPGKSIATQMQLYFDDLASRASLNIFGKWNSPNQELSYQFESKPFIFDNRFVISRITSSGKAELSGKKIKTHLQAQVDNLSDKKTSLSLQNVSMELPLLFPFAKSVPEKGYLSIESVAYNNKESGKVRIDFTQAADGHNFTAHLLNVFNQEASIKCSGMLNEITDLTATCEMVPSSINSDNLQDYSLLPEGLAFEGNLQADARISMSPGNTWASLQYSFSDGIITYGKNQLTGVELSTEFPNLPNLQSKPNQQARIKKITAGDIHLSDAVLNFHIADDLSIFLEKAVASWCKGKIETSGIRFYQEMDSLAVTIYADRLGFSELMSQLGIENTEGEGSLNGKIPLRINDQGIIFNDGFLFSTPGNTGIIKFHNTDQLRQGLPALDQAGYLDYSMTALENFSYNWTKLTFNNQDEDLLITMQLDGKPASPLPFDYKNGRIKSSTKGPGLQHPIRLDVNIRLPLQELFQYGDNLQSIMENM